MTTGEAPLPMDGLSVPALRLPTELRVIICGLLPTKALKDVRLVKKQWGSVAASILFHTFETNLVESKERQLDALFTSAPDGFLGSIKILDLKSTTDTGKQARNLLLLIGVLPRDKLTRLQLNTSVQKDTLGLILRTQTQLQAIRVRFCASDEYSGVPSAAYARGSLEKVTELFIGADNNDAGGVGAWLPHMPSLTLLSIESPVFGINSPFGGLNIPEHVPVLILQELRLICLNLPDTPKDIVDMVDLCRLQHLSIRRCQNSAPLLNAMAQQFIKRKDSL